MQEKGSPATKAKAKGPKVPKGNPNKHQQARISFLYQAATYLADTQRDQQHQHRSYEGTSVDHQPLENASAELATTPQSNVEMEVDSENFRLQAKPTPTSEASATGRSAILGLSRYLSSHLRAVSLKSQVRLSQDVKRSTCKRCSTPLMTDIASQTTTENKSRGGKKPWADVLVVQCSFCKAVKRFPVGSKRQARKGQRQAHQSKRRVRNGKRNDDKAQPLDNAKNDVLEEETAKSGTAVPSPHPRTLPDVE